MAFQIVDDILDITDYYTELSRRLGERFTEELTSTLRSLTRQPGMGSQRYAHLLPDRSLRMWQLDHFPCLLFYRARDETFSLLRVLHERRREPRNDLISGLVAAYYGWYEADVLSGGDGIGGPGEMFSNWQSSLSARLGEIGEVRIGVAVGVLVLVGLIFGAVTRYRRAHRNEGAT